MAACSEVAHALQPLALRCAWNVGRMKEMSTKVRNMEGSYIVRKRKNDILLKWWGWAKQMRRLDSQRVNFQADWNMIWQTSYIMSCAWKVCQMHKRRATHHCPSARYGHGKPRPWIVMTKRYLKSVIWRVLSMKMESICTTLGGLLPTAMNAHWSLWTTFLTLDWSLPSIVVM